MIYSDEDINVFIENFTSVINKIYALKGVICSITNDETELSLIVHWFNEQVINIKNYVVKLYHITVLKEFIKVKYKFISYSSSHELINHNNKEIINIVSNINNIDFFFIISVY